MKFRKIAEIFCLCFLVAEVPRNKTDTNGMMSAVQWCLSHVSCLIGLLSGFRGSLEISLETVECEKPRRGRTNNNKQERGEGGIITVMLDLPEKEARDECSWGEWGDGNGRRGRQREGNVDKCLTPGQNCRHAVVGAMEASVLHRLGL